MKDGEEEDVPEWQIKTLLQDSECLNRSPKAWPVEFEKYFSHRIKMTIWWKEYIFRNEGEAFRLEREFEVECD